MMDGKKIEGKLMRINGEKFSLGHFFKHCCKTVNNIYINFMKHINILSF